MSAAKDLRNYTLHLNGECDFETETCYSCGVLFAMTAKFRAGCIKDHTKPFYCPNGHQQFYTGKTETQRLKEELERERERTARAEDRARVANAQRQMTENSLRVMKGHVTRLKKRAAAGVCPCCKRQFQALARHMKTKHPDYAVKE